MQCKNDKSRCITHKLEKDPPKNGYPHMKEYVAKKIQSTLLC